MEARRPSGPAPKPPSRGIIALLGGVLVAAAACEDDPILVQRPQVQVDQLQQASASRVDILWVVDNSETMVDEQALLAENFDRFISNLIFCQGTGVEQDRCDLQTATCQGSGLPCQPPDYHVGVTSTDPRDEGRLRAVGLCAPAIGVPPANGRVRYCSDRPNPCGPDPENPEADPENDVCDRTTAPLRFVTPFTPRGTAAFAELVRVRLAAGAATGEQGIQAAAAAVGRGFRVVDGEVEPLALPEENQGFLRDDASLFIIFVSDEDDSSFGPIPFHYRNLETAKGVGNEGIVSLSAIVGDPNVAAEEGDGGCGQASDSDRFSGQGGERYVELAMYSRGVQELQVCDGVRLTCAEDLTCQNPATGLPGICLPSQCETDADCGRYRCDGGPCSRCTENRCSLQPEPFLGVLQQTGVFQSICADDYGQVLDQLGFDAAGLNRRFPLSVRPNCSEPVPCCPGDDTCTDQAPLCVQVNGEVVPPGGNWRYDPGSNSVVFVDSALPPARASVTLQYRDSRIARQIGCEDLVDPGSGG